MKYEFSYASFEGLLALAIMGIKHTRFYIYVYRTTLFNMEYGLAFILPLKP